ncbi:phosphatase PAP2 family protein [Crenobacter sp. SG2303]|uniref:Phosphatase PAP2 family protein n=1 Tax=Crenobacter oryzisoli TaxID=3056844 RepID=A0ABT7XVQ1_9NEIS|nr:MULTISPECIES: phosphatase PAP2 family protein [unclassified Crenobacter]MDN0077649.1 phosphatase PAP2 family protein [Crenobacter sp. SG2303]MDN0081735.1 phosphatase PAP2 family protein [Crenobacter sp. SG2305]
MSSLEALNHSLFLSINATAATPHLAIVAGIVTAQYLIFTVPLLMVGLWLQGGHPQRVLAVRAVLVTVLALLIAQVVGQFWPHPRPFMIGLGARFIPHAADSSFPSDHGTVMAAVTLTLLLGRARLCGLAMLLVGVAVAWSRVFLGVHFPFDMLGSVVVAALAYALLVPFWLPCGEAVVGAVERLYRCVLARPIAAGWLRA